MRPFRSASLSVRDFAPLIIVVALSVPALVPLAGALAMQHVLASGTGGNPGEHSDFDLCAWVEIHGSGALAFQTTELHAGLLLLNKAHLAVPATVRGNVPASSPSRAPPRSSASRLIQRPV